MKRAWRTFVVCSIAALAIGSLLPGPALAQRVWVEGPATRPFSISSAAHVRAGTLNGAPAVLLERLLLWQYSRPDVTLFDPFSAEPLANGDVLIADRSNVAVIEVNRRGKIVWSYTKADDPRLINPYSAKRLPNGNTLISDRRADFVIEVTPDKRLVWQYGAEQDNMAPGSIMDPYSATRLANGNTLICDNRFGTRVIEVRSSDYDPTKPTLGYTAGSIVWRYGRDNDPGTGPGQLASPRKASRLTNGNTLIVDSEDNEASGDRVIEVSPAGRIVWQCGNGSLIQLSKPSAAERLANGNTLISEEESGRVLEITASGAIANAYENNDFLPKNGELSKVRDASRSAGGTTIIADQADERVIEFGYSASGTFTSSALSLGLPGVKKSIASISLVAEKPSGTSASVAYSLDGHSWVKGGASINLPAGSTATQLRYRVELKGSAAATPVLRQVKIVYDVATNGDGGGTPPPSNNTTSTGTHGTTGTGNGRGTSGTGTGSGVGLGTGSGTGSGIGSGSTAATGTAVTAGDSNGSAGQTLAGVARFATGTLMRDVGAGGGGGHLASGGSGGNAPAALALLGICYLAGVGGASAGHGSFGALVQALASRFGRR